MIPQFARIRDWITDNYPNGKDKEQILRWCSPKADRAEKKLLGVRVKPKFKIHSATGSLGKADRAFSLFIRLSQCMASGNTLFGKCVTCGEMKPFEVLQCGHWIERGYFGTRFEVDNCHIQCIFCNSKNGLNGATEKHEAYIAANCGHSTVINLQITTKLYPKRQSDFELEEIAKDFTERAKTIPTYEIWDTFYNRKNKDRLDDE